MVRYEARTKCPRNDQSQTCCNAQFLSVLAETLRTDSHSFPAGSRGSGGGFSDNSCLGSSSPKRTRSRGNSSVIAPLSSWLVCGSKASNHSLWFGGEEGADESPRSQLIQQKARSQLVLLQTGLWDGSLQIKSLPAPL